MLQGKGIHWVTAHRTIINHLHKMKAFLAHFTKWLLIENIQGEKVIFIKQRKWMTRNHNLNQLCLLKTKNHPVFGTSRSRSQFSTKTRLITANQTTQFVFATLTNRRDLIISNYNLRRTDAKQTKTVLLCRLWLILKIKIHGRIHISCLIYSKK